MPASHIRSCLDSVGGRKDNSHTTIDYINIDHGYTYDAYLDKVCNAAKSGTFFDRARTHLQKRLLPRDIHYPTSSHSRYYSYQYPGRCGHGWLGSDCSYSANSKLMDGFYCTGKNVYSTPNFSSQKFRILTIQKVFNVYIFCRYR